MFSPFFFALFPLCGFVGLMDPGSPAHGDAFGISDPAHHFLPLCSLPFFSGKLLKLSFLFFLLSLEPEPPIASAYL